MPVAMGSTTASTAAGYAPGYAPAYPAQGSTAYGNSAQGATGSGYAEPVPQACPTCGNVDLQPLGRGTQRFEEGLAAMFPQARILRIDADSTRKKGSAQEAFDTVHRGEVDILIGTQMVAKGHDFQRVTLVGVVAPDPSLFSHDFRAGEHLFASLMQVAGRAGRAGLAGEVLIQTRYPDAPALQALARHDYGGPVEV